MLKHSAFTLIELLVVVTIIVVLLAMLVPAMDKAVYQAELATCGARLRGMGGGVVSYAFDHKRYYPHRDMTPPAGSGGYLDKPPPMRLTAPAWDFDWRPTLRGHLSLKMLQDPMSPKVEIEDTTADDLTAVDADYPMWFGWQYVRVNTDRSTSTAGKGMRKTGDKLEWKGQFFGILAGDWDDVDPAVWSAGTHPDKSEVMAPVKAQDAGTPPTRFTFARWHSANFRRGPLDMNFLYDDLSVRRLNDVLRGNGANQGSEEPDQEERRITRVSLRVFDNSPETTAMPVR